LSIVVDDDTNSLTNSKNAVNRWLGAFNLVKRKSTDGGLTPVDSV